MSNDNQNLQNADGKENLNAQLSNHEGNSVKSTEENTPQKEELRLKNEADVSTATENDFDENADLDQHAEELNENSQEENEGFADDEDANKIPEQKDYDDMSLAQLVGEASMLIGKYAVVHTKKSFQQLKNTFTQKFEEMEQIAKEKFLEQGGNEIDFRFENKDKRDFDKLFFEHKSKLRNHYESIEQEQKKNLKERENIIAELKALYIEPADSNQDIFKKFRELKTRWHNAGQIPKSNANDIFKNYYHHLDNFYEFLDLNQELRKMDHDHNLSVRKSIIERTKNLLGEDNIQKALNELQYLHRMWKEEAVPVAEEHREPTWQEFKNLTNQIHDRKNELAEQIQKKQEENLELKLDVIESIKNLTTEERINSHNLWQKKIKALKKLRDDFFAIGRVPKEKNQPTWDKFKEACREFNQQKNAYYKDMKKEQSENIEAKKKLIEIAQEHRYSTNWAESVNVIKRIQNDWKKIGHVPRKLSDQLWEEFSAANNEFFERYKNRNNEKLEEQRKNLDKKEQIIQEMKEAIPPKDKDELLAWVNNFSVQFSSIGFVPNGKQDINKEFQKISGQLLKKAGLNENAIKNAQWNQKIENIKENLDDAHLKKLKFDLKKQIDELQKEVTQLQNNLSFFSNADESNPLFKSAKNSIDKKENELKDLKAQFHDLKLINLEAIAGAKAEEE